MWKLCSDCFWYGISHDKCFFPRKCKRHSAYVNIKEADWANLQKNALTAEEFHELLIMDYRE